MGEKKRLFIACGIITLLAAVAIIVVISTMGGQPTSTAPEPSPITVDGNLTCLPHKGVQEGQPITLECAIGLKTPQNTHYALQHLPADAANTDFAKHVVITGDVMPPIDDEKYDIAGTITVKSFTAD